MLSGEPTPYVDAGMNYTPLLTMPFALVVGVAILAGGGIVARERHGTLSLPVAAVLAVVAGLAMTVIGRLSMGPPAWEIEIVVAAAVVLFALGAAARRRSVPWLAGLLCAFGAVAVVGIQTFENTAASVGTVVLLGGAATCALGYWFARSP